MKLLRKDVADYVDGAAAVVGITIAPEWRAGVAMHLEIILTNAELIAEAECSLTTEPAPVFEVS